MSRLMRLTGITRRPNSQISPSSQARALISEWTNQQGFVIGLQGVGLLSPKRKGQTKSYT